MSYVYELIQPKSYIRLFNDNCENEPKRKDKKVHNTTKDYYQENNYLKATLIEEERKSKSILALSVLFQQIRKTIYKDGVCAFDLNTLLAYEFFITLSHWINIYEYEKDIINNDMENSEILSDEYKKLEKDWGELNNKLEALIKINNLVVSTLKPEQIYALSVEYPKLTPLEHVKKCLL